ncbi:MAG: acetyl-CoA carboxylase biotin carboxylase subunit [Vicinamibacteraceae bacterium]|nr:acetyl-CoA carboxylase biotin carboxylase subunit [Vicinamibacteraceae bacterium]
MMRRVLVANRGEIAVRIARACRELGIETVAVYSDADAAAPHVLRADAAERLGPAPAAESYLDVARLLDAARRSGADAVHPGYGFLAENAGFAHACREAGLTFIGPGADAIRTMGDKVAARRLMAAAGVPVVPGVEPADQSEEGLRAAAREVGFPLLVKAAAGGGGKGMRAVHEAAAFDEAVAAARREATAAFGDGRLYLERLVERPRHIEVQVAADGTGATVHLFERECSLQRRHQKVIEESPSPVVDARLRTALGEAAVRAAEAVGYLNVGTIEFLVEGEGEAARFYFLEMNTRLQVEHPVTELVTGVDLVHLQLRLAAGRPLPFGQAALLQRGHAIEGRVYAEDPDQGFLPQAGRILLYREPHGPGIRVDAGVVEGSEVTVHYDPLLAKLIVHAETRAAAIARFDRALADFAVLGIRTNLPFLRRLVADPAFASARFDTGYLDRALETLTALAADEARLEPWAVAAAASVVGAGAAGAAVSGTAARAAPDPWATLGPWRLT